jgi:hypothetical protein
VMYGSNSHKMCLYDEKALKRSDCRKEGRSEVRPNDEGAEDSVV